MSLKGILEFALHIKKFRNIDLAEPGFYHLRFTITQETNKKKTPAKLYAISERHPNGPKETKPIKHFIRPHALQLSDTYVTKTFNVSLCEEEVLFNEACSFRVDFNAFPKIENTCYYLEADLMFLDFPKFGELKGSEESKLAAFHRITGFKARIKNPEKGVHEYLPVIFDQRHSCVLNITIHTSMLSLRMKTDSDSLHNQPDQEVNGKEQYLYEQTKNLKKLLYKKTAANIEALDKFYTEIVCMLRESFQKQLEFFAFLLEIYATESDADELLRILDGSPSKDKIIRLMSQGKHKENSVRPSTGKVERHEEKKSPDSVKTYKISEIINVRDPDMIIFAIAQEMITLSSNSLHTWRLLNDAMVDSPRPVIWHMQKLYNNKLKTSFEGKLCQKIYRTSDLVLSFEQNLGEAHNQTAISKRISLSKHTSDFASIENIHAFPTPELHPIIFEEICVKDQQGSNLDHIFAQIERNSFKNGYNGAHLIVLSHGFQGSAHDLRLLKNTISHLYPDTLLLCASSNEEMTDDEISKMGVRLATEVINYIDEWIRGVNLGRLSFIGHSMGGLIIRAALPYLEQYAPKMHLFMTLSTPHLGYMSTSSKLIDAGMWFLSKWKKSKSMEELSLADAAEIENTYLFKLSKAKGVNWFKHIVLLGSYQDQYAPFESARIQVSKKAIQNIHKQTLYEQMASNILSDISADCIYRLDVNFPPTERSLDSMLGRAAHIQFLESKYLTQMLAWKYANFFS